MYHNEYHHIVPNADTAVLFIHGILGTPRHFDNLIAMLPSSLSVYNVLLDGHGKHAIDFSKTSMAKWEQQINTVVTNLLSVHKHIYIVAHSMGTLFAIEQAIQCENIDGLFLLAVPIIPAPKVQMFRNALKVYRGNIRMDDRFGLAAKASCSITQAKNPIHYYGWLLRYLELFRKIHATRNALPMLRTPTIAIHSRLDEMVSKKADKYLLTHSKMEVYTLENSYHYLYDPADISAIKLLFSRFISEITGGKQ